MIDRKHELPIVRQAEALKLGRAIAVFVRVAALRRHRIKGSLAVSVVSTRVSRECRQAASVIRMTRMWAHNALDTAMCSGVK